MRGRQQDPLRQTANTPLAWTKLSYNLVPVAELCAREKCSVRQVNLTISLAFLAPNLVKAAVEVRLPRGIAVERPRDSSTEWSRQLEPLRLNPEQSSAG